MPRININQADLYYDEQGTGPETIVFGHGLLFSGRMFDEQVMALKDRYRCITFDFRGQGRSQVTRDGYDMDSLCEDVAALIERLKAAPCHYVGFSMGGFIGLRLAIRRSELLQSLILIDTSADREPEENIPRYRLLNFVARWFGPRAVAGKVMPIMFSQALLEDPSREALRERWQHELAANHRLESPAPCRESSPDQP
jgi:3-oxoadipate enol-lactonase